MHNKKTIFIIPGFTDQIKDNPAYGWLIKFLKKKRYRVIATSVQWKNRTMADYAADFINFYKANKGKENYVLGFSYGAVIAFITANELRPKKIFLCSLSADFKEDAPKMKPWIVRYIGKKRFEDAKTRSAKLIAKKLSVPLTIFYGVNEGKDYPSLKNRAEETAKIAKKSKLIVVPKAHHDISHPEYRKAIMSELGYNAPTSPRA